MEHFDSDWVEVGPEELGGDRPETGTEETGAARQTLTPKVLDLMEKISEYGYLTMHEILLIFGNKTWAYKVVKGLKTQKFIAEHDTMMRPKTAYHLTSKGYRILIKFDRLKVGIRFKPERYSVFIYRHRMACAKVGLVLEKHPLVHEFLPESKLYKRQRNKTDKVCDGEFCYRVPGHEKADRVGLEVELTLKSSPRLEETFREFAGRRDLDQVWWICGNENIRQAMGHEVNRRYLGDQRHLFAVLAEFLAAKGKADLMDQNGALLSIDPDQPTLLPRRHDPPPRPAPMPPADHILVLREGTENLPQRIERASVSLAQVEAPKPPQPAPVIIPSWPRRALRMASIPVIFLGGFVWALLTTSWEWPGNSASRSRRYYGGPNPDVFIVVVISVVVAIYVAAQRAAHIRWSRNLYGYLQDQGR